MADVTIPEFQGIRSAVPGTYDKNRRAGSGGQRYFTDMEYVTVPSFRGDRAMYDAQNYLLRLTLMCKPTTIPTKLRC